MSFSSRLSVAAATVALAATAFAAPVSAGPSVELAGATVTVVQGIPGQVDICVGGKEIASNVDFGKWASRTVSEPRVYKVRVFRPDPRTCAGTKVISRKVELWPGRDVSMVLKLGRPRVVMFENSRFRPLSQAAPIEEYAMTAIRHAARARDVEMRFGYSMPIPPMYTITEEEPSFAWNAGDEQFIEMPSWVDLMVGARSLSDDQRLVKPKWINLSGMKYHEVYLVGWNKASYKWVVVRRPLEDVFGPF